MKKALFVLLSLVLPLAWSQPAFANASKNYTIHNKTDSAAVVTFSTQACKPYSYSKTIGAKSTGTITAPCGTSTIDVVLRASSTNPHGGHCWSNVKYLFGLNFNVMPASAVMGHCTVNSIAPGL